MPSPKPLPWRVNSDEDGGFDELVVGGHGLGKDVLVHAEMMNRRAIVVSIGPLQVSAFMDTRGVVRITNLESSAPVPEVLGKGTKK